MDVAKYKYPPVWVSADNLFASMSTVDRCGTYDYPKGQERLISGNGPGGDSDYINPISQEQYLKSLEILNCKPKMRGYVILKKNSSARPTL